MLDFMNIDFIGSNVHNPWKKEENIQMFLFFLMLGWVGGGVQPC